MYTLDELYTFVYEMSNDNGVAKISLIERYFIGHRYDGDLYYECG